VAIAITDHDSIEGVPEALDGRGGSAIPSPSYPVWSCRLSTRASTSTSSATSWTTPTRSSPVHLSDLRTARLNRARAIVETLDAAGYELSLDEVMDLSEGGAVGRSHVARALVHRGHAADVSDAFRRLLGRGRPFYVPKDVRTPSEVLRVILDAGGIPVLAHPGVTGADDLIPALVAGGLAGLEAYHSEHDPREQERYALLARELGLLVTGGSDYHGPRAPTRTSVA
jgi:3',5'-nucleoside bisphosphate phosphatase